MTVQVRKEQNEEMDEEQELSAVFNKTLEYTEKFSFYQNRETIKVDLVIELMIRHYDVVSFLELGCFIIRASRRTLNLTNFVNNVAEWIRSIFEFRVVLNQHVCNRSKSVISPWCCHFLQRTFF